MATPNDPNTCEQVSPDTWSQFAAKDAVSVSCYDMVDVGAMRFCKSGVSIAADPSSGDLAITGQVVFATPPQSAMSSSESTDMVNKSYADSRFPEWAAGPAIQNTDLSCNKLTYVNGIEFCDNLASITSGSSTVVSGTQKVSLTAGSASGLIIDNAANSNYLIAGSTPTVTAVPAYNAYASNQLVPRSYIDTLVNYIFPGITGALPNTIYNVRKQCGTGTANLTADLSGGDLVYFFPFVDLPITHVVFYPVSTTTSQILLGFALIEFENLLDISGVCVASTNGFGEFAGTPNVPTPIQLFPAPPATSYTLKAGKKYAVAIGKKYLGTYSAFNIVGYGTSNSDFTGGLDGFSTTRIVDLQSTGVYSTLGTSYQLSVPAVGNVVTQSGGRGFCFHLGLRSDII